ncbi:MAG TPA: endonuclease/exonuclease/phosphatase family protein [Jiangellales bacterium]|nr:endonuclease/exonuclease/phosphatase family protein [Jiangellales bacterium]
MTRLRFGTFNLLHGISVSDGQVREADLTAAGAALDADVVGLQEVDRDQPRSGKVDQTAVVADALEATWWRFAPSVEGTPGESWEPADPYRPELLAGPGYGVGLVSRLEVLEWRATAFPAAPFGMPLLVPNRGLVHVPDEPRAVLAAVVVGPDGPFTVATAHLSFVPGWNVWQLRRLARWLAPLPRPWLVLGDLNLPGALPQATTRWRRLARVPTYPSWRPRVQWDHALTTGTAAPRVVAVRAERLAVSDHCALLVDVDW